MGFFKRWETLGPDLRRGACHRPRAAVYPREECEQEEQEDNGGNE